ncbi:hypothetical protein V8F20_009970 [Naviculisporaceae sp. PSN 640]
MKPREMRLRVVVRRHALPETRIILPVCLDEDPSIADLIELVNDVIPLESEDWGLEDYVAELRDGEGSAFDLLHFQRVVSVLKPDEEVFIRPLLTNDRRQRRLAGRDQITNDGRHLIDGVPFGRPRFKAPRSRPSISIPPLKRRRISDDHDQAVDDDDDDDERPHKAPMVRFNDLPDDVSDTSQETLKQLGAGNEDDDHDSDFVVDEDEEEDLEGDNDEDVNSTGEDLEQELEDLQADRDELEEDERTGNQEVADGVVPLTLTDIDRITALRAAFPTASYRLCESTLVRSDRKPKTAYNRLKRVHEPAMSYEDMISYSGSLRGGYLQARPTTDNDAQSVASNADSVDSFVKHYDRHGFPSGSILAGTAATHLAESLRKSGQAVKLPVHTHFDDSSVPDQPAQATTSEWDVSKEVSDGDENESSDSDAGPEEEPSKPPKTLEDELPELSSSDGSSDGSSESDSSSDDDSSSESDSSSDSDEDDVGDADVNADEDSDADSSFQERSDGSDSESSSDSSADNSDSDSDSESNKGAPLPSASKTVHSSNDVPAPNRPASPQLLPAVGLVDGVPGKGMTKTQRRNARRRAAKQIKRLQLESGTNADAEMEDQSSADQFDLAKRKAALIASLALSADGEEDSIAAPTEPGDVAAAPRTDPSAAQDPERWRNKITYRAVECCQQGIELSEPPFPFYQRWDPQQQRQQRSSKRKQRDQPEYDEEDSQFKKHRKTNQSGRGSEDKDDDALWDTSYATAGQYDDSNIILNYDEETEQPVENMGEATNSRQDAEEDLPSLPSDLSSLPLLAPSDAKPGMILTWKQMILSKATNWAPQVFDLTGSVVDVFDGGSLRVLLAKRDRGFDRSEKQYDEDGNRVYDKFEFPGMDDDELEEEMELGYRTLEPADMMEARILQQPPQDASPTAPSSQHDFIPPEEEPAAEEMPGLENTSNKLSSGDQSTTLDHEDVVIPGSQMNGSIPDHANEEPRAPSLNVEDVSMTEDRRREISQLINDAGFRKEVDPSISEEVQEGLPSVPSSSPSRQLEENLKEAVSAANAHHLSSFSNPSHQDISQATSNSSMSVDSQPIILEPFHGFSDGLEEDDPSEDPVHYPTLDLPPSDIGSTHSGRQPDPDFSIELGNTSPDRLDSVADESLPSARAKTPPPAKVEKKVKKVSPAKSDTSTNSFPSLSEIFLTASTQATQITQSSTSQEAISSALKARKSDVASDLEYEEAMRKLDDGFASSDSDAKPRKVGIKRSPDTARGLLKKPIEKPVIRRRAAVKEETVRSEITKTSTKVAKETKQKMEARTEPTESSTLKREASTRPMRSTRKSDTFVIPAGSQVVSLISSSPEPELEENYADDDVDETYEADSFPSEHDSPISPEKSRNRRGASMPLSALTSSRRGNNLPKRLASSQGGKFGRISMPPAQKQNKKKTTNRGW